MIPLFLGRLWSRPPAPRTTMMALLVALAAMALALLGCETPPGAEHEPPTFPAVLAGTRDVELTYEVDGGTTAAPGRFGEDLRALVLQRLGAAQIGADVRDDGARVHVIVDEAHQPQVDELLGWTGTLSVFEVDESLALTGFEGTRADVLRAIVSWPSDGAHRLLAEATAASASAPTSAPWRTRVVKNHPIGELGDGALVGWGEGPSLRVRGAKGSAAEALIETTRRRSTPRVVVARGNVSLGTPASPEAGGLEISFGVGAEAYTRAANERRLLMTPRLPPLRRTAELRLPPNRSLAIACLVLPVLLSFAWLVFVRRFDRAHPEPMWLVLTTFFLGALATIPAGLLELALASASLWLNPTLATLGGRASALPIAIIVFTVVVGLSEEGSKRLAAQFATRRREFDEPIDGIVYAIVASLGFAAAENVHYFALGRLTAPLVIGRSFMSVPAHMFFGALWGSALGRKLVDPKTRTWPWLLLAAGCHGLFDAMLSIEGAAIFAVVLNVLLASAFVVLVRSALRHGVVTKEMLAIRAEDRVLVPIGRPALFWFSAVVVHVLALGIFVLGAYYQLARHQPTTLFVVGSSVMLGLLAVAALGVSTTMQLDVAIDAYGLTFAGAARSWRQIRGVGIARSHVVVDCENGPILVGPASEPVLEAIATEIRARLEPL